MTGELTHSFKEYIDEYLGADVFKESFNQSALLLCNKIIKEIEDLLSQHIIKLNAVYNKLFGKDILLKTLSNPQDTLSIIKGFDSYKATKN